MKALKDLLNKDTLNISKHPNDYNRKCDIEYVGEPNEYDEFFEDPARNDPFDEKVVDIVIDSKALQPLLHFMPPGIKRHVRIIIPSKKDEGEILFAFDSYPVCLEFNKFHAKELLSIIHANDEVAKILNLQKYTKIRGYVSKELLTTSFVEIHKDDVPIVKARGDFINCSENKEIYRIFEEIRAVILTNQKKMQSIQNQKIDSKPSDYYIGQKTYYKK